MNEGYINPAERIKSLSREVFDEQFSEFQTVEIKGKEVLFAKVEVADNPDTEWFVYIGGFAQGKDVYANALYDVASSGRNILYVNPLEGIPVDSEELSAEMDTVEVPQLIASKANEVRLIMDGLGIDHAHVGGHSQGAAVGATLAALDNSKVGKLLLDAPPGLRGGDNPVRLTLSTVLGKQSLKREVAEMVDQLEKEVKRREGESDEVYAERIKEMENRVKALDTMDDTLELNHRLAWRLLREVPALSSFKMAPVIERIKQLQGGESRDIKEHEISIIMANKDISFEPDKTLESVGNVVKDGGLVDSVASYVNKDESHNAPIFAPPGYYTQKLDESV